MRWRVAPIHVVGWSIVLGANIVLLANVTMQLTSDASLAIDKGDWSISLTGSVADSANRKPFEGYREILASPIFFKSREPFVPQPPMPPAVVVAPPPPPVVDPGLVVGGVMIKNGLSKAYLFGKGGLAPMWAGEGEVFQGWKIKSVTRAGVKLEQAGRTIDLTLYPSD
jgi:hypothetical protein